MARRRQEEVAEQSATSCNEVALVGRLAAPPAVRALPSGDEIATFRLVVDRPARPPRRGEPAERRQTVDTLDCVVWRADLRRRIGNVPEGTVLAVEGAVRRRFWRSPGGPASKVEIEVERLRRVAAPA